MSRFVYIDANGVRMPCSATLTENVITIENADTLPDLSGGRFEQELPDGSQAVYTIRHYDFYPHADGIGKFCKITVQKEIQKPIEG